MHENDPIWGSIAFKRFKTPALEKQLYRRNKRRHLYLLIWLWFICYKRSLFSSQCKTKFGLIPLEKCSLHFLAKTYSQKITLSWKTDIPKLHILNTKQYCRCSSRTLHWNVHFQITSSQKGFTAHHSNCSGRRGGFRRHLFFLWAPVPSPNVHHMVVERAGSHQAGQRLGISVRAGERVWNWTFFR